VWREACPGTGIWLPLAALETPAVGSGAKKDGSPYGYPLGIAKRSARDVVGIASVVSGADEVGCS